MIYSNKENIPEKNSEFDEKIEECAKKIIKGFLYKSKDYEFEKNKIKALKEMANIIKEEIMNSILSVHYH